MTFVQVVLFQLVLLIFMIALASPEGSTNTGYQILIPEVLVS